MLIRNFMRAFFRLLYHPFAFTYDLVAAAVSVGHWKDWIAEIIPFIEGTRILELGHGPGHLQRILRNRGLDSVGLDESTQMGLLAKKRLDGRHRLARGVSQRLPFADDSFDTIVATFPTEYIFDPQTLSEVQRCLPVGGRLAVIPAAYPHSRFLRWVYQITGETPSALEESLTTKIMQPFVTAGFETKIQIIDVKSDMVLIVIATNKNKGKKYD